MSDRRLPRAIASLVLLGAGAFGLRYGLQRDSLPNEPDATVRSDRVSIDLLDEVPFALVERPTREIHFGTEAARTHYVEPDPRDHLGATGIRSIRAPAEDGSSFAVGIAVGHRVNVTFTAFDRKEPLAATLVAAGLDDGQGPQRGGLFLNRAEEPIITFELPHPEQPTTVTFDLPEDQLRDGQNVLRFEFERVMSKSFAGEPYRFPVAAALSRLTFHAPGTPPGADTPTLPPPNLLVEPTPGVGGRPATTGLVMEQGTRNSFALRLGPARPRLVTTLFVHPDDRDPRDPEREIPVLVRLRAEPAGRLLLARTTLDAGNTGPAERRALEIDADLTLFAGNVVSIEFETEPPKDGATPVRIVAAEPAIRGAGRFRPRIDVPEEDLADLKERLRGLNVLVMLGDATAARYLTAYGAANEYAMTIDTLASGGLVFDDAISPASYTLPSVGSLFTGLYPANHGILDSGGSEQQRRLGESVPTMAELLSSAGYSTLGIITTPNARGEYGYDRGFDHYDELHKKKDLWQRLNDDDLFDGILPEAVPAQLENRLDAGDLEEPFFAYAHFFQPHAPYQPPAEYRYGLVDPDYDGPVDGSRESINAYRHHQATTYDEDDFEAFRALYRGNLRYIDDAVRDTLELLEDRELLERTIVVFLSDHGEAFGEHNNLEHSETVFAEEIEIPWIVHFPESVDWAPARVKGGSSLVDFAPTLLSLLSVPSEGSAFDGIDLTPRLFEHEVELIDIDRPVFARSAGFLPRYTVRYLGHAYHEDLWTRRRFLYDLTVDPREENPLPIAGSVMAEYLRAVLARFVCAPRAASGEEFVADPTTTEMLGGIGYVGSAEGDGVATEERCKLLRR